MALGDFGDLLDSQTYPQIESEVPCLRKRTKNVALLLTQGPSQGYMFFRSIAIDDAGLITATPINTFQIETWTHRDKGLIHWLDDVFAAYSNDDLGHGHLWTIGCDENGTFPADPLDYLEVGSASNYRRRSDLIKPQDGILLTGPCKPAAGVHLQTVAISDAGIMPDSVTESMPLPDQPRTQWLRQGAAHRIIDLALVSGGFHIHSLTCTDAGVLPDSVFDSWGLIASSTFRPSLCKISNTVFAVFNRDPDGSAWIRTFSIKTDGTINKSWEDEEQVEAAVTLELHMMEMGGGYFALCYSMTDPVWRHKTYFIAEDGTIQDGHIGTMDRATPIRGNARFDHLHGNIWTLTYEDVAMSVRIDTLQIETPVEEIAHNELVFGIGP